MIQILGISKRPENEYKTSNKLGFSTSQTNQSSSFFNNTTKNNNFFNSRDSEGNSNTNKAY